MKNAKCIDIIDAKVYSNTFSNRWNARDAQFLSVLKDLASGKNESGFSGQKPSVLSFSPTKNRFSFSF